MAFHLFAIDYLRTRSKTFLSLTNILAPSQRPNDTLKGLVEHAYRCLVLTNILQRLTVDGSHCATVLLHTSNIPNPSESSITGHPLNVLRRGRSCVFLRTRHRYACSIRLVQVSSVYWIAAIWSFNCTKFLFFNRTIKI